MTTEPPNDVVVKKRKFSETNTEVEELRSSPSFKIRALLQQLRPHFIEVLRTPDYRNCKAAVEIHNKMKLLIALNKQMATESEQHSSRNQVTAKEGSRWTDFILDKRTVVGSQLPGSYINGGSAVGWNYITWLSSKPVYYGVTKEAFRSCHRKSGDASEL